MRRSSDYKFSISEIFFSIQGEGQYSGQPCIFIRLTGCNLRCSWCDTSYAYSNGINMEISEIMEKVNSFKCDLVEITGGEPLMEPHIGKIFSKLRSAGKKILLETNGSKDISHIPGYVHIIMDIKAPSSKAFLNKSLQNLAYLKKSDEIKIVIENYDDFLWVCDIAKKRDIFKITKNPITLQPVYNKLDEETLSGWILKSGLKFKLGIQLHKFVFGDNLIGV